MSASTNASINARILIVDDDPVALAMLEEALKRGGFEVLRAYGAEDALRKAKVRKPDLVLTDLEMPKVNGVALIAMLREDADTRQIPIIAVTAHTWDPIGQAAAQVGCDSQISKPFAPQRLLQKVNECLAARQAAPAPSAQRGIEEGKQAAAPAPIRPAAPVIDSRGPAVTPPVDTGAIFDRVTFLEYVDGNLDHAQRAIGVLLETLPARLEGIRKAIASQDSEALRTTAHTVKGGVAFFAAPPVVAAAFRLEMMGRSGDLTGAGAVYFDLERTVALLVDALSQFGREITSLPPVPRVADEPFVKLHLVQSRG